MKTTTIYESEDSIIRVKPHEIEERYLSEDSKEKAGDLAYITIYAGRGDNFIHVNQQYVETLYDILGGLLNIYKLRK